MSDGDARAELFRGTASYYARFRPAYPPSLFAELARAFALAPGMRVVDLGCGTGQLALPLAARGLEVTAIDPSDEMLAEGARAEGGDRVRWIRGAGEQLPSLVAPPLQMVACATAFHWMDRELVLEHCDRLVDRSGGVAIVSGAPSVWNTEARWAVVSREVEQELLGPRRRAGGGFFEAQREPHQTVLERSPFARVERWRREVEIVRTIDQLVGLSLSTSHASPALLGDRLPEFERRLRERLAAACPDGRFVERYVLEALLARRR